MTRISPIYYPRPERCRSACGPETSFETFQKINATNWIVVANNAVSVRTMNWAKVELIRWVVWLGLVVSSEMSLPRVVSPASGILFGLCLFLFFFDCLPFRVPRRTALIVLTKTPVMCVLLVSDPSSVAGCTKLVPHQCHPTLS